MAVLSRGERPLPEGVRALRADRRDPAALAAALEGQRAQMINLSSAMGTRFAEIAREFTDRIRKLGPSPVPKCGAERK